MDKRPVATQFWAVTAIRRCVGGDPMLWTIAVILLVLWVLGLVTGHTLGSYIHVLLVIAIIAVLIRIIQGRRVV